MRKLMAIALAAGLVTACGQEPEVTPAEVPNATDPVDTGLEANRADPPAQGVVAWDQDNNGTFDRNEFTGYRDRGFLGWDNDGDRRLSRAEFDQGWASTGWENPDRAWGLFDDNNDTFVDGTEFFGDDEFAELDANNSGVLETEEFGY